MPERSGDLERLFKFTAGAYNWASRYFWIEVEEKIKFEQPLKLSPYGYSKLRRAISYVGNFLTSAVGKRPAQFPSMKTFFDTTFADLLPGLGTLKDSPESKTDAFSAFETPFVEFSHPDATQYSPVYMLCELTNPHSDVNAHFFNSTPKPWDEVFSVFVRAEYVQLVDFTGATDKSTAVQFYFKSFSDTSTSSSMATGTRAKGRARTSNGRRSKNAVNKTKPSKEEVERFLKYLKNTKSPPNENNRKYFNKHRNNQNFQKALGIHYEELGRQAGVFKSGKLSTIDSTTTVVLTGHGVAEYIDSVTNSKIPGIKGFSTKKYGFKQNTLYSGKAKLDDMLFFLYMGQDPNNLNWTMMDVLCAYQYQKWKLNEEIVKDPRADSRYDMQKFDAIWHRTRINNDAEINNISNGYDHATRMIEELLLLKSKGVTEVYLVFANRHPPRYSRR